MNQIPNPTTRWEHHIEYIEVDARSPLVKHFLAKRYPGHLLPRFAAQAAIARLDELGTQGWELVHMEPVELGDNGDLHIAGIQHVWTHVYFCVFKRPTRR